MDMIDHVITASVVSDEQRMCTLPYYFGAKLTNAEILVYQWMGRLCEEYQGGYWEFYALSNGGFYMAPRRDEAFSVSVEGNGYEGQMSADGAGLTACLFAFCELANRPGAEQERFIELYHRLHQYAVDHVEWHEIVRAID